jgi:S1-C subfamily serine protease
LPSFLALAAFACLALPAFRAPSLRSLAVIREAGEVILAINDHYLFTIRELQEEISRHEPGRKITIRYRRYSTINETFVMVGRVP